MNLMILHEFDGTLRFGIIIPSAYWMQSIPLAFEILPSFCNIYIYIINIYIYYNIGIQTF